MSAWAWFLAGGSVLAAVELMLPDGSPRDLVYLAVGVLAVAAVAVGIRIHRPTPARPWWLFAGGIAAWTVGDALWWWFAHVQQTEPFPSVADGFYLLGYPLLTAAILGLSAAQRARSGRASVIDPLVVTVCACLLLWVLFIEPTWTDPEGDLLTRVVGLAYPVGDIMLLGLLMHLRAATSGRSRSLRLMVVGFGVVLVADLLFQATDYVPWLAENVRWLDALWLATYVLWGAAALHPTMVLPGRPVSMMGSATMQRVGYLAVAVILLPALLLTESLLGRAPHVTAVSVAAVLMIVLVLVRMSDLVKHLHDQARSLQVAAATDMVTGLENRRRLSERLDRVLAGPDPRPAALLVVAVDRLAEMTDTLGERTGDELLHAVGERLVAAAEADGVVARTGTETFGVMLPGVACGRSAVQRATELREVFAEPFALAEVTLVVEGAIGVAMAPADATTASELLYRADVALAAARARTDRVARYDGQMEQGGVSAPALMVELRSAIDQGELVLHFQPQLNLSSGRVLGVEALVRWQHPTHGMLPPVAFVPAAERTGLIRQLTLFVLDRGLEQLARWRAEGLNLSVAINLSARDLLDPRFVEDVRAGLQRHALPASALELELTETMALIDPARSMEVLGALDGLGVTISVDDYGTGHSSLAYLQRLPLRRLKIDRSFVAELGSAGASAAIVRSTIELARHLSLDVIAEGVEDDATLMALRDMRCFAAQGYGIGRPVAAEALPDLVRSIEARVPELLRASVPAQRVDGPVEPVEVPQVVPPLR